MKVQKELNALKEEDKNINMKYRELTDDDLTKVLGGVGSNIYAQSGDEWDKSDIGAKFINEQENESPSINNDPLSLNEQFKEKAKKVDLTHF